jgi:CDP-diglyceride synthetase
MQDVISLYISLCPVILAGIANSVLVKTKLFGPIARPIDGRKNFIDHKRIFGDNKTYKGFLGYIILTMFFAVVWGLLCTHIPELQANNFFYQAHTNTVAFNAIVGGALGLAWALFELPNSFIKRRLDIEPGSNIQGARGALFIVLDQADSIFGVVLVLAMFHPISTSQYFLFVSIGAITHILFNFLLFTVGIRKRPT